MPCPSRSQIEADSERLLEPLHNLRQLKPVRRPDIERQQFPFKGEPPHLEGEQLLRLEEKPEEQGFRPLLFPEERLSVIDSRPYFVPRIPR
jgi:hypothetical protein